MKLLYLHTTPPPFINYTDAVHNEVRALHKMIDSEVVFLHPWKKPNQFFPQSLIGWHRLSLLKKMQALTNINHLFAPNLFYFPILNQLSNPVIYSISGGVNKDKKPANMKRLSTLEKIIVSNCRDHQILLNWGLQNHEIVRTGINTGHIQPHSMAVKDELRILMASSPWVLSQFHSKGIDLILQAVKKLPFLRLTILGRGLHEKEMLKCIHKTGVSEQVHFINRFIDIQDILHQVHATVLLAKRPGMVKAFPHSLIESLAAGKPIISSESIPLSDYIRETGCGLVLNNWHGNDLNDLFTKMKEEYSTYQSVCLKILAKDFSQRIMLEKIKDVYTQILDNY